MQGGTAVIDDTMAERMVTCGWIAAVVNAALTVATLAAILSRQQAPSLLPFLSLIDVGFLLALAYGIYRRSRVCAIAAFAYFLISTAFLFEQGAGTAPAFMGRTLFLTVLYVLGAVGTFVHHARRRPATA
ncbi:MAG: hypothetical protein ACREPW_06460 [Candidatus Binataceae bacterium]